MQYDQSTTQPASLRSVESAQNGLNALNGLNGPGGDAAPEARPPSCLTGVPEIGEWAGKVLHAGADTVYLHVPIPENGLLKLRGRLDDGWLPPGCLGVERGLLGYDRKLILEDGLRVLIAPETNAAMGLYVMCGPAFLLAYRPDAWALRIRSWLTKMAGGGDGGWWREVTLRLGRVDECVDVLYAARPCLDRDLIVSDAKHRVPGYYDQERWTGLQYGRKDVVARVYDKPYEAGRDGDLELWAAVWGYQPSEGEAVLRYEGQVRGDRLRELGLTTLEDYAARVGVVWRYTFDAHEGWWRVAHPIGRDHEGKRQPVAWYASTVAAGLDAFGSAVKLLTRQIRLNLDPHQLAAQIRGTFLSLRVACGQAMGLEGPASAFVARRWLRSTDLDEGEVRERLETRWRRAQLAAIP